MDIRTMGRSEADFLMGHICARLDEIDLTALVTPEDDEPCSPEVTEEDFRSSSKK